MEKLAGSLDPAVRLEKAAKGKDAAFYEGVLSTAEYYMNVILPVTNGKLASIAGTSEVMVNIPDASFGG